MNKRNKILGTLSAIAVVLSLLLVGIRPLGIPLYKHISAKVLYGGEIIVNPYKNYQLSMEDKLKAEKIRDELDLSRDINIIPIKYSLDHNTKDQEAIIYIYSNDLAIVNNNLINDPIRDFREEDSFSIRGYQFLLEINNINSNHRKDSYGEKNIFKENNNIIISGPVETIGRPNDIAGYFFDTLDRNYDLRYRAVLGYKDECDSITLSILEALSPKN